MKMTMISALLVVLCSACSSQNIQNKSELEHWLVNLEDQPGLQYVVFDDAGLLYSNQAGLSDIGSRRPMEKASRMAAYSMSKTYTAVLILKLNEAGLVDLEAPVKRYLPWVPYPESLRVRHLLSQTSGIPDPVPLQWVYLPGQRTNTHQELLKILAENPELDFEPGEKYAYSNISYWLLEELTQEVTGQPFAQLMFEQVFSQAGLEKEQIGYRFAGDPVAKGYLSDHWFFKAIAPFLLESPLIGDTEQGWLRINPHLLYSKGMGGIFASAESLALVMVETIKPGSSVLGPKSQAKLFEVQKDNQGRQVAMTLGWHVQFKENQQVEFYFKEGGGASFHTEIRYYPETKTGTMVMANSFGFDVKKFLNQTDPLFIQVKP